jgi:fructose-1,6-bisphosphatase I
MGVPGQRSEDRATDDPRRIDTVLNAVSEAVGEIRGGFQTHRHDAEETNPSGEDVLAADVFVDELLQDRLGDLDCVGTYASEERADPDDVGEGLSLAVDPLDGSSNLESNNGVGTIVGLYDAPLPADGTELVGAMYVLYGPVTTAMVATPEGVTEYMLSEDGPEVLTEDVRLPESGAVYGFGGPVPEWSGAFRRYAMSIQRRLKRRYGGALVGDVNQVLSKGGVFAYPALESRPEGKLRLQFEGNPIAYIVEQAGGRSFDGEGSVLEADAERLHQRTPLFVGSEETMAQLVDTLNCAADRTRVTTRDSPWPDQE